MFILNHGCHRHLKIFSFIITQNFNLVIKHSIRLQVIAFFFSTNLAGQWRGKTRPKNSQLSVCVTKRWRPFVIQTGAQAVTADWPSLKHLTVAVNTIVPILYSLLWLQTDCVVDYSSILSSVSNRVSFFSLLFFEYCLYYEKKHIHIL